MLEGFFGNKKKDNNDLESQPLNNLRVESGAFALADGEELNRMVQDTLENKLIQYEKRMEDSQAAVAYHQGMQSPERVVDTKMQEMLLNQYKHEMLQSFLETGRVIEDEFISKHERDIPYDVDMIERAYEEVFLRIQSSINNPEKH